MPELRTERPTFFAASPPGEPGLAIFLNAGDPPLDVLGEVITMLDESGVDCLELAVPFPASFTDGPTVRRSATRALAQGTDLADVLALLERVRPTLRHLRIAMIADWAHTVRPIGIAEFLRRTNSSGVDGLLLHGLPATQRSTYYDLAHAARVPVVSTCYPDSDPAVQAESANNATAYLYLVAHYGRSGTPSADGFQRIRPVLETLRANTTPPIAVGFGVRGRTEIEALRDLGADAVIIGSAAVARVEKADAEHRDVVADLAGFVAELRVEKVMKGAVPR
ncbi:MAG TPA: tryptophan synthase subunit alpha [Pseudonocardiaceae bacterium]|jgi:tryptophan synthase alpha chain|nr:tryptophan synthase subunit alpha [Pseudonocardiaceae bacterium]